MSSPNFYHVIFDQSLNFSELVEVSNSYHLKLAPESLYLQIHAFGDSLNFEIVGFKNDYVDLVSSILN